MTDQSTLDLVPGAEPEGDDALNLATYAQRAYLEYALSVVKGRALPDVCDGQKPVQRRILYAMSRMGLGFGGANGTTGARPVKSARVVGDVLGRFHPHGDQAAYDALVRMAQDFSQRYPLIDGQGNFGSRDGDGAAAMRYTEARLARITNLLLDEIDEGTVDFIPNYDGSTEEPSQLAARLPFALLNGASGIAVGMATEIPSHNLREIAAASIALIRDPQAGRRGAVRAGSGPRLSGWRADHQRRRRHRRRLPQRPRFAQGACALEDRGTRARPVAAGGDRAAAQRQHAAGARGDRGADQSQGPHRQEGLVAGADPAQGQRAGGARRRARRVEQGRRGAPGARTQDQPHLAAGTDPHAAGPHQPGDLGADQPDHDRHGPAPDAEVAAPDADRVDRVPPADGRAALAPPPGQGAGPHPYPGRAPAGAAQHRRGDRHHPRGGRAAPGA